MIENWVTSSESLRTTDLNDSYSCKKYWKTMASAWKKRAQFDIGQRCSTAAYDRQTTESADGGESQAFILNINYTQDKNKTSVALYLPKTLITPVHFCIVDTGYLMGERNALCHQTPRWEESC
ncbi:hypothetical protein TNCV_2120611 [Trichonephila clavipes]|nr:hypothetical protein TNCV_2120611 [Trichonephila clavipes]